MGKASIIVPTYNCAGSIGKLLNTLTRQSYSNIEIIIVDSSSDGTDKIAEKYGVKVVKAEKLGLSYARNIGVRKAKGEFLCFTDGDCWVEERWVEKIVEDFKNRRVGCIGGSVIIEPVNVLSRYMGETIVSFFPKYNSRKYIVTISQVVEQPFGDVRLPVGCNMAFRRKVLEGIGGFDEGFKGGYEEFDVMIKLLREGWLILIDPEVKVYHEVQTSITKLIRKTYNYGKGAKKLIRKYKLPLKPKFKRGFEGVFRSINHSKNTYEKHGRIEVFTYPILDILFGLSYYLSFTIH